MLKLIYSGMHYWRQDRHHQGIFDIHATEQWSKFVEPRVRILTSQNLFPDSSPISIFEIGCSEGMLLKFFHNHGHEAAGCEANRRVAELGNRELSVNITPQMFENVNLVAASYDLVVSFHTVEHLPYPTAVFRKIAQILKPTGSVCIEVPIGEEEYSNYDHLHFFSKNSLQVLLRRYFSETKIVENCFKNATGVVIGSLYGIGRYPIQYH
jgi:2-polyprenyl-3-methyl-5-hydroxy-6-metoxy-1,4-benzoquinol methylase